MVAYEVKFWGLLGSKNSLKTMFLIRGLGKCERVGEDSGYELIM